MMAKKEEKIQALSSESLEDASGGSMTITMNDGTKIQTGSVKDMIRFWNAGGKNVPNTVIGGYTLKHVPERNKRDFSDAGKYNYDGFSEANRGDRLFHAGSSNPESNFH
jgi:hypothetical protein